MIRDLLNAEVAPGVTLKDVPKSARSAELEFLIPISASLTAKRLVSELKAMDPKYDFGTLRPEDLKGFLTGFIDLAFSAGGRFYVLDWKSNKISPEASGYTEKAMSAEMDVHLYRLQYLIYWVALRRFLQVRLALARRNDWRRHLCVSSRRTGRHDDSGQPSGYCFRSGASRGDSTHG